MRKVRMERYSRANEKLGGLGFGSFTVYPPLVVPQGKFWSYFLKKGEWILAGQNSSCSLQSRWLLFLPPLSPFFPPWINTPSTKDFCCPQLKWHFVFCFCFSLPRISCTPSLFDLVIPILQGPAQGLSFFTSDLPIPEVFYGQTDLGEVAWLLSFSLSLFFFISHNWILLFSFSKNLKYSWFTMLC